VSGGVLSGPFGYRRPDRGRLAARIGPRWPRPNRVVTNLASVSSIVGARLAVPTRAQNGG
jgi:hypothetical protein